MGRDPSSLCRYQGVFNVVGGLWPLVNRRSFEWVFGPKADEWLMYTVGGLMASLGWVQLAAGGTAEGHRLARRAGTGAAFTLLTIDLIYVPAGRIRPTYLLDAAMEVGWLLAWFRTPQPGSVSAAMSRVRGRRR
ncbi:hypothetical protein FOS14_11145 [Skermania sp. ID1734]|uniref:hypothetical protein n=1 Tax=Skermania sp. ID1734 TaxID=2597516 RepID=UPI00117E8157|nr:hypothetical protein [Skermania sp. ID1734]TSD99793.1 hypothetical protein FOS14_11145 [Skermania sp. ID1734]